MHRLDILSPRFEGARNHVWAMSGSRGSTTHFSLSAGGLVQLIMRWMRGPESADFPIPTQTAIAVVLLWLPLVVLSLFEGSLTGTGVDQPLFADIVPHVQSMRLIPATLRGVILLAAVLLAPFLPLALTEFSIQDLFQRLTDALV